MLSYSPFDISGAANVEFTRFPKSQNVNKCLPEIKLATPDALDFGRRVGGSDRSVGARPHSASLHSAQAFTVLPWRFLSPFAKAMGDTPSLQTASWVAVSHPKLVGA